ncbi:MAG TPA: VanW family protein [Acidimicrobiia bacterium]|nr:VanW family protein [Acidimicrobiia bacterium]
MSTRARVALLTVTALIFVVLALFGAVRLLRTGEILGSVSVAGHGVALGGLTPEEADEALAVLEQELSIDPVVVDIAGAEATVLPQQLGFALDRPAMVEEAMRRGREGGVSDQFRWWLSHLFATDELEPSGSVDEASVEAVLTFWDVDVVGNPPVPGGVVIEGTTPVAVYPETGLQVDRSSASDRLLAGALGPRPATVTLDTALANSRVTRADVDAAVARAQLWLSSPVRLSADDVTIEFSVSDMAAAFTSTVVEGVVELGFDPVVIAGLLDARRSELEAPPVDARLEVDGYQVIVVPGRNGTLIDPEATAEALAAAASSVRRQGELPFVEGAEPEVTTAELEALGIEHLLAEFTTYHPCCQNRVTNIHLMADIVNGAIVAPGAIFGVNAYVGQRTTERGFLEDGTIIQGELVETVGGGVSQFATTMYNAVFWSGLEDVSHRPHSFYFSRYPEGIEATISWQQPELEFRNDTDHAIWIRTAYTDTSITVRIYGSNDGRILVGDHAGGTTNLGVVAEGGPNARRVRGSIGDRFNPTEPTTEHRPNPELEVEETNQLQSPAPGWTVVVTRVIEQNGAERMETWTVRYLARREILEVHPCKMPGATVECPEPTTTTLPPETTTTPPPPEDQG